MRHTGQPFRRYVRLLAGCVILKSLEKVIEIYGHRYDCIAYHVHGKNFVTATYRDVYEYLLASTCDFNLSDLEGRPKSTFSADSETPSQVYVSGNHGCMWHRLVAVRATTDRQTKPSLAFPLPGMRGQ